MEDWFANAASNASYVPIIYKGNRKGNPCLGVYKTGPDDKRCKDCELLVRRGKFFKCELRGITRGPGTDHRANWPASGRFVQRTEEL